MKIKTYKEVMKGIDESILAKELELISLKNKKSELDDFGLKRLVL